MSLVLLPALDIAAGRVVPHSGHAPLDVALAWQSEGAEWVHLVDLDAAFARGSNIDHVTRIIGELDIKVELSAGVRDDASLHRALATGCDRIILRSPSPADLAWCRRAISRYGNRVVVALDVHTTTTTDQQITYRLGARGGSDVDGELWDTLADLDRAGCARFVVTDVGRDGAMSGPNFELCRAVTAATSTPTIASGGVGSISDLRALIAQVPNLEGVIVGGALHAGRFTLREALTAVRHS